MEYSIGVFVDKLLEEKGISGVSPLVLEQLKGDLVRRAEDLINAEILANMPESVLEEFEKKLDEGDTDAIQIFCKTHISNMDEIVAQSLIRLHDSYITRTSE